MARCAIKWLGYLAAVRKKSNMVKIPGHWHTVEMVTYIRLFRAKVREAVGVGGKTIELLCDSEICPEAGKESV
jgi:hypothetical protein